MTLKITIRTRLKLSDEIYAAPNSSLKTLSEAQLRRSEPLSFVFQRIHLTFWMSWDLYLTYRSVRSAYLGSAVRWEITTGWFHREHPTILVKQTPTLGEISGYWKFRRVLYYCPLCRL